MTPEPLTTWDSRLRRVGSLVLRHGVTCAVGGALALLLAGELLDWRREQEPVRRVVTVRPTSRLADAELVRIPADLVVPVIPGRTLTRLERDYATGPLATVVPSGDIVGSSGSTLSGGLADAELVLGEFRLPRLPEGGGGPGDARRRRRSRRSGVASSPPLPLHPPGVVHRGGWSRRPARNATGGPTAAGAGCESAASMPWSKAGVHRTGNRSGAYAMLGAEIRFGAQ